MFNNGCCERCSKKTNVLQMSFLNTQMICPDCFEEEKSHPNYEKARAEEREAVKNGNYNYDKNWIEL